MSDFVVEGYWRQICALMADNAKLKEQNEALQSKMVKVTGQLVMIRESLQFANESPGGPINDTIWMMHTPSTLFDYIDDVIEGTK